ncbi:aminoglycoside phosphotransferase family protein [Oerskovia merdavium]|uniref:Aminoglycoside phosphotransferase family protein n=1 Tax=Oerskovia merdavium TaxID=2762227 RepID=A0ABR8U2Z3_9CELL|nr:aminoglycoside phosphotransferase family protein [Oerskovia merdavium]MBD7982411.1 aminoglycoside phosphotransferase family protein [Oerskovia merdavium]
MLSDLPPLSLLLDAAAAWSASTGGGGVRLVEEWVWPHGQSRVARVRTGAGDVVVKWERSARNVEREVEALRRYVRVLGDDAGQLLAADMDAHVLVMTHVPGTLAAGAASLAPDVHRQAGTLLARLHASAPAVPDEGYGERLLTELDEKVAAHADLVDAADLVRLREVAAPVAGVRSVRLVPAHRDFGPRNWLVDAAGHVRVIDFAHSEPSPWAVDLQKLTMREWRGRADLEAAFLEGYGRVPDDEDRLVLRAYVALSALATIAWSVAHDDPGFEAEARSVLAELVAG